MSKKPKITDFTHNQILEAAAQIEILRNAHVEARTVEIERAVQETLALVSTVDQFGDGNRAQLLRIERGVNRIKKNQTAARSIFVFGMTAGIAAGTAIWWVVTGLIFVS